MRISTTAHCSLLPHDSTIIIARRAGSGWYDTTAVLLVLVKIIVILERFHVLFVSDVGPRTYGSILYENFIFLVLL